MSVLAEVRAKATPTFPAPLYILLSVSGHATGNSRRHRQGIGNYALLVTMKYLVNIHRKTFYSTLVHNYSP
jgi:hypothetical protein